MRIDTTVVISVKDDQGNEVARSVGKHRGLSFEYDASIDQVAKRVNSALKAATQTTRAQALAGFVPATSDS